MKPISQALFQIGKNGLSDQNIEAFKKALKTHNQIRISLLKSSGRDKEETKKIASEIAEKMPFRCSFRIVGFTIILKKLSSLPKEEK